MPVDQCSKEAFQSIQPHLSVQQRFIYNVIKNNPQGITDKELAYKCGMPINCVTPRRGELLEKKLIFFYGIRVKSGVRGKKENVWGTDINKAMLERNTEKRPAEKQVDISFCDCQY